MQRQSYHAIIEHVVSEKSDVKTFSLKFDCAFAFIPGQYVMIAFPDEPTVKRAFSVLAQKSPQQITLGIKLHGSVTQRLFSAKKGDALLVFGPYGRFVLPKKQQSLVFVGGGIGVTPLLCLLQEVCSTHYPFDVHLFYSAKNSDAMVYQSIIDKLHLPFFHSHLYVTQKHEAGYFFGRVSAKTLVQELPDPSVCMYYICGPSTMISELREQLLCFGISDEQIKSEDFHPNET